jgi:cell wall-associated NlpC family hydrolase
LPPLPKVDPRYTNGESPQKLLANAISLVSVGSDTSAVQAAIAVTQAHLVKDAATAAQLRRKAAVADQKAAAARQVAQQSSANYHSLDAAVKRAVIFLYTQGPVYLTVNPAAGQTLDYAMDYADTAITPTGILATRSGYAKDETTALAAANKAQRTADQALKKAAQVVVAEQGEQKRLAAELSDMSNATATAVASDHTSLATQAAAELVSATTLQFTPKTPLPAPLSTTPVALAWAFAELGKPYVWAATGPDSFDCSGLTQYVWKQAGVSIPRVAADQDSWTVPVPLSRLLPGDLVFFGTTDIHHVGIYIGDGLMINAPHTGTVVQVSSIWWSDLNGFGRVHDKDAPVPNHAPPTPRTPAPHVVVPTAGPVPSQTKPPKGWKPKPGQTTPIRVTGGNPTPSTSVPRSTTTISAPSPVPSSTTTSTSTTTTTLPGSTTTTTLPLGL